MNSEETTEKITEQNEVLKAIAELSAKVDNFQKSNDIQFEAINVQLEAIRTGTLANNVSFERLVSKVFAMSANLTEMQEEMRRKELV